MIRFAVQISGLTLALMLPSAGVQAPGSIEGSVVALGSSMPVPRAAVTLTTTGGRTVASLTTTIDGRFSIAAVAPGEYRVTVQHEGFAANVQRSPFIVASGRRTDVSIEMVPYGAISGRVVDWDGLPVAGSQVQALTFMQDARGQRTLGVRGSAQTNDLGEYRIYWIQPGQYFVSAAAVSGGYSTAISSTAAQLAGRSTPEPPEFVSTYFPSATEAAGARRIDLRAGETFSGADIHLSDLRKQRVSGVVSITNGRSSTNIRLTPRNPVSGLGDLTASADQSGVFKFDNVAPGAYILSAAAINSEGKQMFGRILIDVGERAVENAAVLLTSGFDFRVQMTIDGRSRRSDDPPLVINLRPAIPSTPSPTIQTIAEESFTIFHNLMLGDYTVAVLALTNMSNGSLLNRNLYLKSAQLGGTDVLANGLHIDGPPSGVLEIVMADGAGTLSGSVFDEKRLPVYGTTVVLVPESSLRGRPDLYKTALTDAAGKFEISGITPGRYKAFSWEAVGQGSWQYPDFMELYEDRGRPIRIDGGKIDPITIQSIPSR